jgi:cytosine/creatinine deaminase
MNQISQHIDLVFRNACLENSRNPVDIAITNGRIVAIQPQLSVRADREYDVAGTLASSLFIDPHQHLDCAYLSDQVNRSGTLREAISMNAALKPVRTHKEVVDRACWALEQALWHGTGWIRSHVDIDSTSKLKLLHAVLEAREKFRGLVDVQIVAFPQGGLVHDPATADLMRAALREGADVVGGIPHIESSIQDAGQHIRIAFDIAREFDVDIDMHVDETDDPAVRTLELLAEATIREGYQGRVTAGHCCALAAYDDQYAARVIGRVQEAGIHVITNPLVNLYLQGRDGAQPVRRGITRVKELLAAGVNVSCGLDDVANMFFPFGRMDMLEVAMITALAAHLSTPDEIRIALDMPRTHAARILKLNDYDLKVGALANMTFIAATSPQEALRLQPARRYVVRNGSIVAQTRVEHRRTLEGSLT